MHFPNERLQKSFQRLRPHGTRSRYQQGCRCFHCRRVCAEYQKNRIARHKAGEPSNHIVSATRAREHILTLGKSGVGLGTISEISGVNKSTLSLIRLGRKAQIREANERLILSVTKEARIDATRVSSKKTRRMVVKLNQEGFTHAEIAKRAGVSRSVFLPRKRSVYARTEMRVERFYNKIMAA